MVSGGVVFGVGGRVRWAGWPWGWLCQCPRGLRVPGVVGVAHSRALGVGGNRGIMRNSNVGSGHGPVPMCVDPPDRTWEPDHHRRRSLEKPVIPTKNSPRPAEAPASHVQHRRQPHPPRPTLRSVRLNPTHPTSRRARRARERKPHAAPQNRQRTADPRNRTDLGTGYDRSQAGTGPISMRNSTDLATENDRSRHGVRPISTRSTTDLDTGCDRSRRGCQAAYVIPRRRPSHSIWSAIATDHVAQVCLPA